MLWSESHQNSQAFCADEGMNKKKNVIFENASENCKLSKRIFEKKNKKRKHDVVASSQ